MVFPTFELWLEDNRELLEEEWNESLGDGGIVERYEDGHDFLKWTHLQYDAEKKLHITLHSR